MHFPWECEGAFPWEQEPLKIVELHCFVLSLAPGIFFFLFVCLRVNCCLDQVPLVSPAASLSFAAKEAVGLCGGQIRGHGRISPVLEWSAFMFSTLPVVKGCSSSLWCPGPFYLWEQVDLEFCI